MGVASHLRIELDEYDARIRTFVPNYDIMISVAAGALQALNSTTPTIVDLGVGTGALAVACRQLFPRAALIGIDSDPGMLEAARRRLRTLGNVQLQQSDFLQQALPRGNAMVACISLHHIRSGESKAAFYHRVYEALEPGGMLVSADCHPGSHPDVAESHREAWLAHLESTYSRSEAEAYLDTWAGEDTYFPLDRELAWLQQAGFKSEVMWRQDGFAVVAGFR